MKKIFLYSLLFTFLFACTKDKKYEYEVDPVNISGNGGDKNTQKTTSEFISIAYADVFGVQIPQSRLVNLSIAYSSFGDEKVIEDRIIRNFLNDSTAIVPDSLVVNGDTSAFISKAYKKFYNREPSEFEVYTWKSTIRQDASITPLIVYYTLMTSDEYRFY
ncbi:MAG TPA: hypothetical protein PKK99_06460 [Bacteroidia bacterium]|nr:hypothetical protein [Bacteroidia bacterium]HNP98677.1 hypothetical protein [Bacteroidia bacterium]